MKATVKYYSEPETGQPLAVFFNTLSKGVVEVYSPVDKHQRATYEYVVNLPEANKSEVIRMKKILQAIGYLNV